MKLLYNYANETDAKNGNRTVASCFDDNGIFKIAIDIEVDHVHVAHIEMIGSKAVQAWNQLIEAP
jgi:hypothetical protein